MPENRWFILGVLFVARFALGFQFQSAGSVSPFIVVAVTGMAITVIIGVLIPYTALPLLTFAMFGIAYAIAVPIIAALPVGGAETGEPRSRARRLLHLVLRGLCLPSGRRWPFEGSHGASRDFDSVWRRHDARVPNAIGVVPQGAGPTTAVVHDVDTCSGARAAGSGGYPLSES